MARILALRSALRSTAVRAVAAAALAILVPAIAAGASALAAPPSPVDAWVVDVDAAGFETLRMEGVDVLSVDPIALGRWRIGLALARADVDRLGALGLAPRLWRDPAGRTYVQTWDAIQQEGGFTVYRSWDEEGGIRDELQQLAADHPDIVKLVVYGQSVQGRDLLALKVTKDANTTQDGSKPATMYSALQHAREWIAIETNRRLVRHFVESYGTDPEITQLLTDNEYWFIVAANPDGYQFTFTQGRRLWRKNMRDNDGNGEIANGDGVDLNRNFDANWNYDTEGSSGNPGSETYRGPTPASEPETALYQELMRRIGFRFVVNYHSAAELILWPEGWQDQTHTADDPIYRALAGTIPQPAIEGFAPILSAGLYITNGETCDFAHTKADALCYTPELSTPPQGSGGSGFEFPDDEALIQAEFEKNLPFALDIARSTADPANPSSHLGNVAPAIVVEPFAASYGGTQPVEANVRRDLGEVTMVYAIDGGAEQRVPTTEWEGGERFGATGDVHYHRVRGVVTGAAEGDRVAVRFEAGGQASAPFEYVVEHDTGNPVLLVVDEDYTGIDPTYDDPSGPRWADAVAETLVDLDLAFDTYDVDAHGRTAPSALGVLSHYDAVVWHTGDDVAPRVEGMTGSAVSRRARDTMLSMRAYLNEGGKLVYAGKYAGSMFFRGLGYDPVADLSCNLDADEGGPAYCESLSNDFAQYYLGAWGYDDVADATLGRLVGQPESLLEGLAIALEPAGSPHIGLFTLTSDAMQGEAYERFAAQSLATVAGTGVRPRTGEHFLYSGEVPYAWQQVRRTVALTDATTASLSFWTHRQTRQPFDALIVEARATSGDAWTTLPDANGHTSQTAALSCQSAQWFGLFPKIVHYMTPDENAEGGCAPVGTTGAWHAATGASDGWEEWSIDLSAYAGAEVELSISYVRSRIAFFGVLLDDVTLTVDGAVAAETSFEDGLGGWTLGGLEANGQAHAPEKDFRVITHEDLPQPEGSAIVVTEDSALLGFGLESLPRDDRREVLRRLLGHIAPDLEGTPRPTPTPPPTERDGTIYLPVAGREWRQ